MGSEKAKSEKSIQFSVDVTRSSPDLVEVPGVTQLLKRKNALNAPGGSSSLRDGTKTSASPPSEPPPIPSSLTRSRSIPNNIQRTSVTLAPPSAEDSDQVLELKQESELSSSLVLHSPLQIQPAHRKSQRPSFQLILWDLGLLKLGKDPLGQAISKAFEMGATRALFLSVKSPPSPTGGALPLFASSAAVNPGPKQELWTGLSWDPALVPEVWNSLIKSGMHELSPPGLQTSQLSNRNVARSALGISKSEWLTLVRAGTAQSCRGLVALLSDASLLPKIQALLPTFFSATPSKG